MKNRKWPFFIGLCYDVFILATKFGDYKIDRKVAVGGMAEIYKALDSSGHTVAIKKIHPDLATQEKFVQMFLDEVRIVIQLNHANVVQLLDFGLIDGSYYYAMEWVEGKTLSDIMMAQKQSGNMMPVGVALLMMIDLCEGLHYAHTRTDRHQRNLGIIHRDISPPNIMVTHEGVFKVTDFGIAQVRDKNIKTQPGIIRGKFSYMSPEQSQGKELDPRSDLFSAAVVLYEVLTLKRLFLKKTESDTLEAVRKCVIPPLKESRSDVPSTLEHVLKKALSSNRDQRYKTTHDFALALTNILTASYPQASRNEVVHYLSELFPEDEYVLKTQVGMDRDKYRREFSQPVQTQDAPSLVQGDPSVWDDFLHYPYASAFFFGVSCIVFAEIFVRFWS